MPTKIVERKERVLLTDYWARPDSYGDRVIRRNSIDKPNTSRRKKPADLFANGTSRTVWSRDSSVLTPFRYQQLVDGTWRNYSVNPVVEPYSLVWRGPSSIPSRDHCDTKTLLAIKDQKVNLSVSIAELGKTTDMTVDLGREVFQFLRSLRKGDVRGVLRAIKHPSTRADRRAAEQWLRFQYGIMPTALEIHGLSELLYDKITTGFISGKVSAGSGLSGRVDRGVSNGVPLFTEYNGKYIRKNTYRYRVDSQGLKTLSQSGITNPALLAYELVPYSFVLDWFIPIGDYLSTLDALVGVKDLLVIRSDYEKVKEFHVYVTSPGGVSGYFVGGTSQSIVSRSRRLGPTNTLKAAFPKYQPYLSTKRLISSVALFRNLFK